MNLRSFQPRATVSLYSLHHRVAFNLRRTLIAAPNPKSVLSMTRRSDRALPEPPSSMIWVKTLPIFLVVITTSALALINYQKSSSSVVSSTLYALRTSEVGRRELGDEIYFRDKMPWIWGELNQLHGRIDISYAVKGTKSKGTMRFKSVRKTRMGYVSFPPSMSASFVVADVLTCRVTKFRTEVWSLETEDGRVIQLLDGERVDPFLNTPLQAGARS
ncbi:hypothetical protein MMC07_004191 [Pseudocyphellaria aurata]|nr:hypothetical protein [Pseudocyphellaria aurata]